MGEVVNENNYMINDLAGKKEEFFSGKVISAVLDNKKVILTCDNGVKLIVHVVTDRIIRFRYATDGRYENDFSYALVDNVQENVKEFEFVEKIDHYRITTDRVICTIQKEGLISKIINKSGIILSEDEKGFHWEYNKEFGGDIVKQSKKLQSREQFYGLGDKSSSLEMRGKKFQLWGSDQYGYKEDTDPLYKNIPFYIGLTQNNAYGIFFDNSFRSFFDFGCERSNVTSFFAQGGEMNYYFIYGPTQQEVVEQYADLTGKPELPPIWSLGYHQCKWSYYPESKVKEITSKFRELSIPCDAIYLDIDYMDGFRCFTWDKEKFPDPKRMIKELSDDGFKTVVIIDPGIKIDDQYSVYNEAIENDYFCKRMDGPLMKGSVWPGLCNFPDYTRPEVREWWSNLFKGLIQEDGVKGVWNDMNEPAVFEDGTFPLDVRHDYDGNPCSHRKAHNVYGMQMARATNDGVKKFSYPDRPFTITRSGYAGMQRFSSTWTGDNVASWEHLKIANIQCQRLSVSGMSFAGSDIGGFIDVPDGELYVRWLQMGALHPFCRTHSSGDTAEQEPWSFGEPFTNLAKKAIELRYKLLPYIYTTFWQNVQKGTPMIRPLNYLDQTDIETHYRMEEFGLGDNLLICPISQPKVDGRWLYLPKGEWYYYWTDEKHEGRNEVWADANMERIPLYVKGGAVLPHFPVMQYTGEKKVEVLDLHVYYTDNSLTSVIYEDKGDGDEHLEGKFKTRTFTVTNEEGTLVLRQLQEGDFEPEYSTFNIIIHGHPSKNTKCSIDQKNIKSIEFDGAIVFNNVDKNFTELKFS